MAILGMMSLAIYRFVQSNLIAMRASSQAARLRRHTAGCAIY